MGGAGLALCAALLASGGGIMPAAAAELDPGVKELVPLGQAVGIKLFSDGVLVVGLSTVDTAAGPAAPGKTCGLRMGDRITHINGQKVNTIEEVQAILEQERDGDLTLQVVREDQNLQLTAQGVETASGQYQLGVWLRDSMAGIGTMTFYDPDSGVFAALGHGINDVDTAQLMPLESGSVMEAEVDQVQKGEKGQPGQLQGIFNLEEDLGVLYANTDRGIFGRMEEDTLTEGTEPVPVAQAKEVSVGSAVILSTISGDNVEEYTVEIKEIHEKGGTRNLVLEVTDPRLLETTGGIVQGMSGSPILQNGKLVGAVTHVLVNDPTKGYGILIENMLDAA